MLSRSRSASALSEVQPSSLKQAPNPCMGLVPGRISAGSMFRLSMSQPNPALKTGLLCHALDSVVVTKAILSSFNGCGLGIWAATGTPRTIPAAALPRLRQCGRS